MIEELSLEITYDCPHNCQMCSSSACHPSPLKDEMKTSEIQDILFRTKNSSLSPKNFSLSGGEPLQRADIYTLMRFAKILGYKNLLYTTGQTRDVDRTHLIDNYDIKNLAELDVKMIFDLQSPDEKTCDKIMGTDGYFDNVVNAIIKCKEAGLEVETHFVPMTLNFKHFFDYLELAKELDIDKVSYLRFVRQGRGHENPHLELSKKQFKELQFMFIRAEEELEPNNIMRLGHPIDRRFLVDPHYPIRACRGATDAPLIHPEGSVVMCPAWKELKRFAAGNVREQNLEHIMKYNPYYQTFYNFIHETGYKEIVGKCQECPYLSRCKGGCVAQRLIHNVGKVDIPLEEAIKIGSDPMCFWGD